MDGRQLTLLDLFAGIGGFSLAAHRLGIKTTQFIEINPDAQSILNDHFPDIPIHSDIRDYEPNPDQFALICSSFPCTGTSNAGKRNGLSHPDSALWRHGLRICATVKPRFFVTEQPLGVVGRGLRAILGGLRMVGYYSELGIVRSSELGAGHERPRLFVISYPNQWRSLFSLAPCWSDQMRSMVQKARLDTLWLSVKRTSNGFDNGVSQELVSMFVPNGYPGRIRSRYLAGRSVIPAQASIPLQRVLHLNSLLEATSFSAT